MIRLEAVVTRVYGVGRSELDDWIARGWIASHGTPPDLLLDEAELARVQLVRDLRGQAGIAEDTLAVVLSLLDQVADLRHALDRVQTVMAELPPDLRHEVLHRLRG